MSYDTRELIRNKETLRDWLTFECAFYGPKRIIRTCFPLSEQDCLRKHQIVLRKTEYCINTGKRCRGLFYRLMLMTIQNKYGLHIPINTCGRGLHIVHLGPILINGNAIVGENCSIHVNTAVVADGLSSDAPIIDDGVILGVGSVVLGGIYIAKNIAVGANAVVTKSFHQQGIAIAGVPARKISDNGREKWNQEMIGNE